jgi:hypothetical protein
MMGHEVVNAHGKSKRWHYLVVLLSNILLLGETANSIEPPDQQCQSREPNKLCDEKTCFSCNSIREANSQTVRGTLLVSIVENTTTKQF